MHVSRQRAQAAYDLIDYYNHFSKGDGDTTRLDNLQKDGGKEGRHQAAIILRRLSTVAKEVDLPNADKVILIVRRRSHSKFAGFRLARTSTSTARSSRKTC